jgi:hypothetical protein
MRRGGLAGNASVMLTSCIFLKMSYDLQAKSVALADMKLLAPNTPVKRQAMDGELLEKAKSFFDGVFQIWPSPERYSSELRLPS